MDLKLLLVEKYVAEKTAQVIQNQAKTAERFDQIEEFLAKPPEERAKLRYRIRKTGVRLEKKVIERYKEIHTDFT